ncbi:glycoside hydrolase family 2 TIM barrel-domain containing protein [Novosphingobium sp. MMS21-SN21R]|uniref:glycoside hydrolase family 2 TIM barrel-domain containing protein n=1 Tax=Novosphingobium sp. MMS21-SN21R TaxID=2969298 RepID=UPI002884788F|nr:glycoside hydrolase family 2 TIM barrel-domain containing protein [Novosphingobium sp. MMS21-SN21R]MDT0510112.1 glycoside hydrolase family 2 TIM barrel-domain containing protein [Novosphingobium sp. MMS21-SN21R]
MLSKLAVRACLVSLLLFPAASHANGPNPLEAASQGVIGARIVIPLTDGWRFRQGEGTSRAEGLTFDDQAWASVSLPHSWNRVGLYQPQVPSRINTPEVINKAMGLGWYRLSFTSPARLAGKRVWLEFDAASRIASVWLNGKLLGEHQGGYSRFRLDATDALRTDGPNILAVRTDNSRPDSGSSTVDVLPLSGDFFVPGGLYRPVRIVVTNNVHVDMLDSGGPGAYATTRSIEAGSAVVDTEARVANGAKAASTVRVRARLIDAQGTVVASQEQREAIAAGGLVTVKNSLRVDKARLWQGVDDPYLYRFVLDVLKPDGEVIDSVEQPFGIRTIEISPTRGFLLNGEPYAIRGVGYHQDREDKGWAISRADVEGDIKLLREMGATSIRLTHYQHSQYIHELADQYGLILWDEIPLVSQWTFGEAEVATEKLRANARQQMAELIRQNQNHASVAVWGIANEVDFGNSLPAFLTGFKGAGPDPLPLLAELNRYAKTLDPTRPTALATCCEGRLFAADVTVPITAPAADVGGANRYFGWYFGEPGDLPGHLDLLRSQRPSQPLSVTEYGAGGALSVHTDNVLGGMVDSRGRAQPEEYESYIHEQTWPLLSRRSDLWGTWLWAAFDFASTVRHEGDADDINTKGLITFDHKTRKDAYYFYKANWTSTPTVYVTGRRYANRAYAVTDVRVYSNARRTTLTVNGKALPTLTDCPQRVCVWTGVQLQSGANEILARGEFSGGPQENRIFWQVAPEALRSTRIDSGAMVAARAAAGVFGSDNFFQGGKPGSVVKPADFGKPAQPTQIAGTADSEIAATYREGEFRYRIPVSNGKYRVTLTFIESSDKSVRVFDVLAGGRVAIGRFDPAKSGAAANAAVIRSFVTPVRDGLLDLWFKPRAGQAIVSAIQVERVDR